MPIIPSHAKTTIAPEQIEWIMDWSDRDAEGNRKYPDKPEKEVVFENEPALAMLIMNEVIFLNKHVYVNCNDVFAWGCADCEVLETHEIESLYRLWSDERLGGAEIWCLIKRKELPQGPVAKQLKKHGWDLEALAKEHGLRTNFYDGVSMVFAGRKYDAYCAWERANWREPRPFDAKWWEGWREYEIANPDWNTPEWKTEDEKARQEWIEQNGHGEKEVESSADASEV